MEDVIYELENKDDISIITLVVDSLARDDNIQLKNVFTTLLNQGNKKVVLDLSKTLYISSIVLASLVFMQKNAKEAGGSMVICGVNVRVKEILEMTNLDKILDIVADKQEAINKLVNKKP